MAAGAGFKTFNTGDVLSAADVNTYLMQGVWVFANAAARDAAVTSPQEGNFAYLKDTNVTTYYTGSAWANLDTTGMTNPMTTTGDTIYSSSGSTPARLGIGSTGQVLTVSGGLPSWQTPAGGTPSFVGVSCTGTGTQSINNTNWTMITWDTEQYDTDGFHSTSTNTSRITIPSGKGGYYLLTSHIALDDSSGTGDRSTQFWLNGVDTGKSYVNLQGTSSGFTAMANSYIIYLSVGDYVEAGIRQASGTSKNVDRTLSNFQAQFLGA